MAHCEEPPCPDTIFCGTHIMANELCISWHEPFRSYWRRSNKAYLLHRRGPLFIEAIIIMVSAVALGVSGICFGWKSELLALVTTAVTKWALLIQGVPFAIWVLLNIDLCVDAAGNRNITITRHMLFLGSTKAIPLRDMHNVHVASGRSGRPYLVAIIDGICIFVEITKEVSMIDVALCLESSGDCRGRA